MADDFILSNIYSKKIELAHYQLFGSKHNVMAGTRLVNLIWYGCKQK